MEEKEYIPANNNSENQLGEENTSSFDLRFWLMRIFRNWYLFAFSITLALGIAYFQNRKWQPTYQTSARVMIEEGKTQTFSSSQNLMQGFGVQASYRNVNNQIIMLGSYDLIKTVVNKLPLTVECYKQGKFKQNSLYNKEPIRIIPVEILPEGYGIPYSIEDKDINSYIVSWEYNDKKYSKIGNYEMPLKTDFFTIVCSKTKHYLPKTQFYFSFKSEDKLVNYYSNRLAINFVMTSSSVVSVSLVGKVAESDIDFVNALCETFIEQNLERKNEAAIKTISFIDQQLSEITDSISVSERKLKSYRISNQIIDVQSYTAQLLGDIKNIENNAAAFKLKEAYFTYLSNYLDKSVQDEIIVVPSTLGINDPTLMRLVTEFNDLQNKKRDVGKLSPYYSKYTSSIEVIKNSLKEVLKGLKASMDIERRNLKDKTLEINQRIAQLPDQESQMSNYQRKYKINDNYYTYLLQKRAESQIQKASNSADNILLERARVMSITNAEKPKKTRMLYFMIGLLLPIGFLLLKDFLNDKIVTRKDIERYSPYPYLGSVQHSKSSNPYFIQRNPRSAFAESYRIIRTRAEFLVKRQSPIVMLVSSAQSADGKTAFCVNMASMYSLTGKKTILVDLDLRKPSIKNRLNIHVDKNKGVSNYLANQIDDINELIIKDTKHKFDIIPGGSVPPNPGELVRSERLKNLFKELSSMYDYVIIDTSPIGLVSDTYVMMHWTDINLFIVRSEKTRKLFFKNVIQQLRVDKVPNISIVLNDVDERKASYYSTYVEYGRKGYYMKNVDYQAYISKYFEEEETVETVKKSFKEKVVEKLKDLLSR